MAEEVSHLPSCQRCKLRKIRCDHAPPKCAACTKASSACIIVDPITQKQYTREYIHDLERKEKQLSEKLNGRPLPRRTSTATGPREHDDTSPRDAPSAESTTTFGGYVGESSGLKLVSHAQLDASLPSDPCSACCNPCLQIPNGALGDHAKQDRGHRCQNSRFLHMTFLLLKKLQRCWRISKNQRIQMRNPLLCPNADTDFAKFLKISHQPYVPRA